MTPSEDHEPGRPNRCLTVLYYAWKICSCLFSHVVLVSLVVAYCILGAFTFRSLEKDNELEVKRNISRIRQNVTDELWLMFETVPVLHEVNWTKCVRSHLKSFEQDLLRSMKKDGWDGVEDEQVVQWTFAGALFYSIIVITTIGYGHIAPKTPWGKVVTIFYAILGIPLMLLCLSNIGDIMAQSFRFLYWRVCCFFCTRKPKKYASRRTKSTRSSNRQSGRYSGRSRTSSFKRYVGTSQRSADSAIGMSESMTRSSYSDTECRYFEDNDREVAVNRASTHSRLSDTTLQVPTSRPSRSVPAEPEGCKEPVLCNKYAVELEDAARSPRSPRRPKERPRPPASQQGGCIARQASFKQRHQRLSRLREDPDYEDYDELGLVGYDYDDPASPPTRTRPVPIWLCVFLVVTYIFCGALLFMNWEEWSFLDAAYFCFITLTTIGFGDFVPARRVQKTDAGVSIALCSLYLLFGIALLAMSFNLVQEEVINNVKAVAKHLGIVKDDEEEDEGD
ncbi:potassium channel subfamily K member 18-like isoform X2 [Bacillus rossius redtenbacheri]|uniref:potassium channel subfamily K member 18-like isoform X2 n=1 Tax=Bacillus rossius redtenbacheri TaxID=93214 RepID=UPI002FDEBE1E